MITPSYINIAPPWPAADAFGGDPPAAWYRSRFNRIDERQAPDAVPAQADGDNAAADRGRVDKLSFAGQIVPRPRPAVSPKIRGRICRHSGGRAKEPAEHLSRKGFVQFPGV